MNSMLPFSIKGKKIYVAGHSGLLGSSICRALEDEDVEVLTISHSELDLTRQSDVEEWMKINRPDVVIIAAAKVGGIRANDEAPAEFIYQNITIEANLIHSAYFVGVQKLIMLGSSCCYPKMASQPINESSLMSGKPEPTNQWYTVAKIAGIKLCEAYRKQYAKDFISILPANLYGPNDNFNLESGHVIPSIINRLHSAKISNQMQEIVWGSGDPLREFMYVDDAAHAIIFLLINYSSNNVINVGTGDEISIFELSNTIAEIVNFDGELVFDSSKPDGAPRKVLDVSKLHDMGWMHKTSLKDGLDKTYNWYIKNVL
jgi:GDP-L-fucose synthase